MTSQPPPPSTRPSYFDSQEPILARYAPPLPAPSSESEFVQRRKNAETAKAREEAELAGEKLTPIDAKLLDLVKNELGCKILHRGRALHFILPRVSHSYARFQLWLKPLPSGRLQLNVFSHAVWLAENEVYAWAMVRVVDRSQTGIADPENTSTSYLASDPESGLLGLHIGYSVNCTSYGDMLSELPTLLDLLNGLCAVFEGTYKSTMNYIDSEKRRHPDRMPRAPGFRYGEMPAAPERPRLRLIKS